MERVSFVPAPAFFRLPVALEDGAGAFARAVSGSNYFDGVKIDAGALTVGDISHSSAALGCDPFR